MSGLPCDHELHVDDRHVPYFDFAIGKNRRYRVTRREGQELGTTIAEKRVRPDSGSLLCILMRSAPLEPRDTAAIAAAVFSSSLSLGTNETALAVTLTRWPRPSSSSRTWTPHVTALLMSEKAIAASSRTTRSSVSFCLSPRHVGPPATRSRILGSEPEGKLR
jgi:hypothetical protein